MAVVFSGISYAANKAASGIAKSRSAQVADIGNKTEYMFGNATGGKHNIERSLQMSRQLNRAGIYNNDAGRDIINDSLNTILNDSSSIANIQENGRIVRESLLTGPNGILKMESVWEKNRLITVNFFGKADNWFK